MATEAPSSMSGLVISADRQTVSLISDIPTPSFIPPVGNDPHQYLVKVTAAGITEGELFWRSASIPGETATERTHHIPAHEVSGTVLAIQKNPNLPRGNGWGPAYAIGDQIFGFLEIHRNGAAAEYVIAYENEITAFPPELTPFNAAGLPEAALTAWQGLFAHYHPTDNPVAGSTFADGSVIVVTGALSAVGRAVLQIAAWAGAQQGLVAVVDDAVADSALLNSLGATEVLSTADFDTIIKTREDGGAFWPVTLVFDTVGSEVARRAVSMVQKSAMVLTTKGFGFPIDDPIPSEPKTGFLAPPEPNGGQLGRVVELVNIEMFKTFVSDVVLLKDGVKAFEDLRGSSGRKKLVLDVAGSTIV